MNTPTSRVFLILLAALIVAMPALADGDTATASGTAEAQLIAPLTLVNQADLDFGKMIKNFSTGSNTVTLVPQNGTGAVTSSNNTELMLMGGHADGDFLLTGEPGETVQLDMGGSFVLSKDGVVTPTAQQQMTVNAMQFIINNGTADVVLNDGDTFVIPAAGVGGFPDIGGTLTVNGDTETGSYTGTVTLTASYQ